MKALMAVTGLIMIAFLLMHMYGNLKMFLGAESFNHYAEWLKGEILYPLVPKGWFIWIFRAFMVVSILLHMYAAGSLWARANRARGTKYVKTKRLQETYAARTMRVGGVILVLFLVFHLLQFTTQTVTIGYSGHPLDPYSAVVASFSVWWVVLAYLLWVGVVCLHVRHGFWSAFATLGANVSPGARHVLNVCAWVVAGLIFAGFMIMPISVLAGVLK